MKSIKLKTTLTQKFNNNKKIMSKKLSKYIASFDYFDKALIVLSTTSGGISIIFLTSIAEVPVGTASASVSLIFSLSTGIMKKVLEITRDKMKRHNKIVVLAKSKLTVSKF